MSLTAIVSSNAPADSLSLLSSQGVGIGGIFVTALLAYLLAYLNVVEASERNRRGLRSLLVAAIVPLALVFAGIVTFESLTIIGLL